MLSYAPFSFSSSDEGSEEGGEVVEWAWAKYESWCWGSSASACSASSSEILPSRLPEPLELELEREGFCLELVGGGDGGSGAKKYDTRPLFVVGEVGEWSGRS